MIIIDCREFDVKIYVPTSWTKVGSHIVLFNPTRLRGSIWPPIIWPWITFSPIWNGVPSFKTFNLNLFHVLWPNLSDFRHVLLELWGVSEGWGQNFPSFLVSQISLKVHFFAQTYKTICLNYLKRGNSSFSVILYL